MVQRKPTIKAEMDEVLSYLNIYKESFPENPAFAAGAGKKKPAPVPEPVKEEPAPVVDVSKVVEDALSLVADAVIFSNLSAKGTALSGSNHNLTDALAFLQGTWSGLTCGSGTWSSAKATFVETFSRLVNKSATQVAHSSKSFSDLNAFVAALSSSDGSSLLS
jgi:hypothetical protein